MPVAAELGIRTGAQEHTGPSSRTGDFKDLSHQTIISIVNDRLRVVREDLLKPERAEELNQRHKELMDGIANFAESVQNEGNYPEGAGQSIRDRLALADSNSAGQGNAERIKHRLAQFHHKPNVISDLDGTITLDVDAAQTLVESIPTSADAEPMLAELSRDAFSWVHAVTWQDALREAPELFREAGQRAIVRPGVDKFFEYAKRAHIPVTILSANFEPYVRGVLDQVPNAAGTPIIANKADYIIATDKASVIEHEAKSHPDRPVIFAGDGKSDKKAINKLVAGYLALESSEFAAELKAAGLPYVTYRDFNDVTEKVKELQSYQTV